MRLVFADERDAILARAALEEAIEDYLDISRSAAFLPVRRYLWAEAAAWDRLLAAWGEAVRVAGATRDDRREAGREGS